MRWRGKICEIYDLWWNSGLTRQAELRFWQDAVTGYFETLPDRQTLHIVELCSGTGRLLLPVARSLMERFPGDRLQAVGLDYSPEMNQALLSKLERSPYSSLVGAITVHLWDLTSTDWTPVLPLASVDVFLFPFNHLGLLGCAASQENVMRQVGRHLKPGGILLLADYSESASAEDDSRLHFKYAVADERKARALFYSRRSWPLNASGSKASVSYDIACAEWRDGGVHIEHLSRPMTIAYLNLEELTELLATAGLEILDRKDGCPTENRHVILARKLWKESVSSSGPRKLPEYLASEWSFKGQPDVPRHHISPTVAQLGKVDVDAATGPWNSRMAEIYDLWWSRDTAEALPFWQTVAREQWLRCSRSRDMPERPFRMAELFAGTGRILLPVAHHLSETFSEHSIEAWALDMSSQMLDRLRHNLRDARYDDIRSSVRPTLQDVLAETWDVTGQFDLVLCPFNHLGLLGDKKAQEMLVKNITSHLAPEGILVLEEYNPDSIRAQQDTGEKTFRWLVTDPEEPRALFYWRCSEPVDRANRFAQITYAVDCVEWRQLDEQTQGLFVQTIAAPMTIRYQSPRELDALLEDAGLVIEQRWGDLQRGRFRFDSDYQYVLARKPLTEG